MRREQAKPEVCWEKILEFPLPLGICMFVCLKLKLLTSSLGDYLRTVCIHLRLPRDVLMGATSLPFLPLPLPHT